MADAMVTARMAPAKKELVARTLEELGTTHSQFINSCYDYVLEHGELPVSPPHGFREHSPEEVAAVREWLDALSACCPVESRLQAMTDDEIRKERLISRGLAVEEDFA